MASDLFMNFLVRQAEVGRVLVPPPPWASVLAVLDDPYALFVGSVVFCGPNNVEIVEGEDLLPRVPADMVI